MTTSIEEQYGQEYADEHAQDAAESFLYFTAMDLEDAIKEFGVGEIMALLDEEVVATLRRYFTDGHGIG